MDLPSIRFIGVLWLASFFPISAYLYQISPNRENQASDRIPDDTEEGGIDWRHFILPLTAFTLAAFGFSLLFNPLVTFRIADFTLSELALQASQYGFIAAYLISLVLVYRNYNAGELKPSVYLTCVLALFSGSVLNLAFFEGVHAVAPDLFSQLGENLVNLFAPLMQLPPPER